MEYEFRNTEDIGLSAVALSRGISSYHAWGSCLARREHDHAPSRERREAAVLPRRSRTPLMRERITVNCDYPEFGSHLGGVSGKRSFVAVGTGRGRSPANLGWRHPVRADTAALTPRLTHNSAVKSADVV